MFSLVDDTLEAKLSDPKERAKWLILDQHPDFPGYWVVEGFTKEYLFDLQEVIGAYRELAPSGLEVFIQTAEDAGYKVGFFDDPISILDGYTHLNEPPSIGVRSSFPNTVNGMLPYQVQGFNLLKDLSFGVARWDTGTGKTILASALIKYHLADFDYCFFVVKAHNKYNTNRKLWHHVDLPSVIVRGTKERRDKLYDNALTYAGNPVLVMNYEQFRDDLVEWETKDNERHLAGLSRWGETFFEDRRVMMVWDEMPTKLKTRTTQTYRAICYCLYRTAPPQVRWEQLRPKSLRSYMLSATPIENSPEDWFNCVRLLDGGQTYGTVTSFNNEYVASWNYFDPNKPERFHNLDRMRLKSTSFVHQVNKNDPDIKAVFPEAVEELVYIDWDEHNERLYKDIQEYAKKRAHEEDLEDLPIFALIGALQMVCDAPEMLLDSAAVREAYEAALEVWDGSGKSPAKHGSSVALALSEQFGDRLSNKGHPKLDKLREILTERHPTSRAVVYARWNKALMPYLEERLEVWDIPYVCYTGTPAQKQKAQDTFQTGQVQVFLSSDSGSDSIDLDAGNVVIDYDLPWKWTTLTQRHNRIHRASSTHDTVYYYSLMMESSVEERVLQVITLKQGYHNDLFDPTSGDLSASARMTKDDLLYILTGS